MTSEHEQTWTRGRSFLVIVALYVVATTGALWLATSIGSDQPYKALIVGYAVSVAFLYIASQVVQNGSTFDAWWSVLPPAFAVWGALSIDGTSTRNWLIAGCALLWGVRLTANWAIGWTGLDHEDWRYRMLYETAPMPRWAVSFTSVHLFPLIVVTLGSLPMAAAIAHPQQHDGRSIGVLDIAACVVALIGVALEHFADVDLRRFNRTKQPGDVLNTGLWSRSRHPNYLGEMFWWWSLFLFAVAADPGSWWTGVGALTMTIMFLAASIPIAEKRSAERRPGWAAYKASTPLLIPRLRK
jgi:steroid 5-alpha reductase family enzyme